jgi:hypothetical protein
MLAGKSENIVDEQADSVEATTAASIAAIKQRSAPEKTPRQRRIDTMRYRFFFYFQPVEGGWPFLGISA